MSKKLTKEEFIEKARKIHGDKYNYDKVIYTGNKNKVIITCPIHGDFEQRPNDHLSGYGCRKCANGELTKEQWVKKANNIHNNKYDYSLMTDFSSNIKSPIICPIHGVFYQRNESHLSGLGCAKCSNRETSPNKKRGTTEEFIKRAKEKHGNKYDYSKVKYISSKDDVTIICSKHGEFTQTPQSHLRGSGCPKCAIEFIAKSKTKTLDSFIKEATQVHDNFYDYSKVNYINYNTKVEIICPIHGSFWQTPNNHLNGINCPKCNRSKLENEVAMYLSNNKIKYIEQYRDTWLGKLVLDFYLPDYNLAIECQGIQHFYPVKFFDGERGFKKLRRCDIKKFKLCSKYKIKLFYFSHEIPPENMEPYDKIYTDIDILISDILSSCTII